MTILLCDINNKKYLDIYDRIGINSLGIIVIKYK